MGYHVFGTTDARIMRTDQGVILHCELRQVCYCPVHRRRRVPNLMFSLNLQTTSAKRVKEKPKR